ncbi:MAG: sulfotransferase [Parvularculaceae bacterium]|nr:sulfotransferase [Parvularculaceae bacterium]
MSSANQTNELLRIGFEALQAGRTKEAAEYCRRALSIDQSKPGAHFLVGLIAQDSADLKTAVRAFGSATKLDPQFAAAWAHLSRVFMRLGQPARAESAIAKAIENEPADAPVCDLIGVVLSLLGDQKQAREWYAKACAAAPDAAQFSVNLATASMFLGENEAARNTLAPFIGKVDSPAQAEWLYSSIVKAADGKRAETLMRRAKSADAQSAAFLAFAAGKEFEDCGAWTEAFEAFEAGARAKRSTISYDEEAEERRFEALAETFADQNRGPAAAGFDDGSAIFVVGQPRTGTTLIERIITSHSQVESAGELQQFRLSLNRLAQTGDGAGDVAEAVRQWSRVDPNALGREYIRASAPMRSGAPRFVDKLPGNYQYIPLILTALPNARIVHLTREPMDACFASYKQLFAEAYLHSYDQCEMARHFARYHRLMNVWRRRFPGRFLDVSYEDTVKDFETNVRRLIEFLDLPWEDGCLRYYERKEAVATASAVQVREKPHSRSIGRWRRYEKRLSAMRETLEGCGVVASGVVL